MNDTASSISSSAKRFFSGTMISRISGLGRDMALAFAFGTGSALAAFLVAFRFAHLLRRLLGEGAFQSAFIPAFESLRHESSQRAGRFFITLHAALGLLLIFIVAIGIVGCSLLLWQENLSSGNAEIIWLTLLMLPSLLFICFYGLNASLLQCGKKYFLPAVAPTAFNVVWIIGALSLKGFEASSAMTWLALSINGACFAQWLVTVPATWKMLGTLEIDKPFENIRPHFIELRRLSRPLWMGMIGVGASQVNNALDVIFARYADPEGPAFLWYAIRFQQLPLALIGIALAGALLPALSRTMQTESMEKCSFLLRSTQKKCILLMLPVTLGMFIFGKFVIKLLYGYGDFDAASVMHTTYCLWGYAAGLIPMALVLVIAPGFYALNNYRIPMQASLASMLLNIALNSWFVLGLGWGTVSVAIATSLSAWFNVAWLSLCWRKKQNISSLYDVNNFNIVNNSIRVD